jgi:hypothetical protein
MANIKIELDYAVIDGADITFRAPCDCSSITGLVIDYPQTDGSDIRTSKTFTFKDAHGNNLINIDGFKSGAYIKVLLDIVNNYAFIQNPDTNGYLEGKFNKIDELLMDPNKGFESHIITWKDNNGVSNSNTISIRWARIGNIALVQLINTNSGVMSVTKESDINKISIKLPSELDEFVFSSITNGLTVTSNVNFDTSNNTWNATYISGTYNYRFCGGILIGIKL